MMKRLASGNSADRRRLTANAAINVALSAVGAVRVNLLGHTANKPFRARQSA